METILTVDHRAKKTPAFFCLWTYSASSCSSGGDIKEKSFCGHYRLWFIVVCKTHCTPIEMMNHMMYQWRENQCIQIIYRVEVHSKLSEQQTVLVINTVYNILLAAGWFSAGRRSPASSPRPTASFSLSFDWPPSSLSSQGCFWTRLPHY